MNASIKPEDAPKLKQGVPIGRPIATLLAWLFPLWLLLMSGFIIFAPLAAFLIWIFQQEIRNNLKGKWKLGAVLFVLSVSSSGLMGWGLLRDQRTPNTFLLKQGYVGWFRVRWDIHSADPLPVQNGGYILFIPANGLLNTSTRGANGWAVDTFFYIDEKGRRTQLIYGDKKDESPAVWSGFADTQEQQYFLGTQDQFMNAAPDKNGSKPKGAL